MRWAALIIASFPLGIQAQGPIETRNHAPSSLVFLRFDPRGDLLAEGERSLSFMFSSANSLRFDRTVREDNETERLTTRFRWGVPRGEWGLEIPLLVRGGGFQDPLIDAYHKLIGVGEFRSDIDYGRHEERLGPSGSFDDALGLGDIVGTYARPLGPQALASVAVKLPTGNAGGLLGSGAVDVGASLHGRWKLGRRLNLYAQASLVYQGAPTRLVRARRWVDQESLAFEVPVNSRDAWTLQWQSEPSAIRTGRDFSDGPHRQLSLGFTRRTSATDTLQLFFSEDGDFLNFRVPELANVAPDFTFGVRWTRRM